MANTDNPRGLWAVKQLSGGQIATNQYEVDATAGNIFPGDLLTAEADGHVVASTANDGVAVIGVCESCMDSNGSPESYHATGSAGSVLVWDNPDIIFGIQSDTGTAPTIADVFATANHVAGSGSTLAGRSGHELDASDIGTGLQFKIIGKIDDENNSWAAHVDMLVLINEHHLRTAASI